MAFFFETKKKKSDRMYFSDCTKDLARLKSKHFLEVYQ